MTSDERYQRMDSARVRSELTVVELWLRYVALGGRGDAFDLDGYLQGLLPLDTAEQDVVAHALNGALAAVYRSYLVPLSSPPSGDDRRDLDHLLGYLGLAVREEG